MACRFSTGRFWLDDEDVMDSALVIALVRPPKLRLSFCTSIITQSVDRPDVRTLLHGSTQCGRSPPHQHGTSELTMPCRLPYRASWQAQLQECTRISIQVDK